MTKKSREEKIETVINKNTFYFFNKGFEEEYEGYLSSIKETLLVLKNDIEKKGLKEEIFESLLIEKENGLKSILALTGLSNETLKRLITIARITNNPELNNLVYRKKWAIPIDEENSVQEWTDSKILNLIKDNTFFRKGIVNIFFQGGTVPFLSQIMPLFELKKLTISKLKFEIPEMIDTLIRYKEKGSYSAKKENNPEIVIENILKEIEIPFGTGDLGELVKNAPDKKRRLDFIIPNKKNPLFFIECSFLSTTSSGQGDKSKTEISVAELIHRNYPKATFLGFVDGIGWYVRKKDLGRMVTAYEDVFTFDLGELKRFKQLLEKNRGVL